MNVDQIVVWHRLAQSAGQARSMADPDPGQRPGPEQVRLYSVKRGGISPNASACCGEYRAFNARSLQRMGKIGNHGDRAAPLWRQAGTNMEHSHLIPLLFTSLTLFSHQAKKRDAMLIAPHPLMKQ